MPQGGPRCDKLRYFKMFCFSFRDTFIFELQVQFVLTFSPRLQTLMFMIQGGARGQNLGLLKSAILFLQAFTTSCQHCFRKYSYLDN